MPKLNEVVSRTLKTWDVKEVGWEVYLREVAVLSKGRGDVKISSYSPGMISLMLVKG